MRLTVIDRAIADIEARDIVIRPIMGAYELMFPLDLMVDQAGGHDRKASIHGARIRFFTSGNMTSDAGLARPEMPIEVVPLEHARPISDALYLTLQSGQLAELERRRDGGDLHFQLDLIGTGIYENGTISLSAQVDRKIARSNWISELRKGAAKDILLLEVPVPLVDPPEEWVAAANDLQKAVIHYQNGDYHACVASCRTVLDEIGRKRFDPKKDWATPLLNRLANNRTGMARGEREAALWATVRHYTQPAHHAVSDGGEQFYSRAEAQLMLTMVSSLISFAQSV